MTPERYAKLQAVLAKRQPDLTLITDQVHKSRNLAAIVRNCDAVGIDQIHCVDPEDGYQSYMGTSASAEKWVELCHHPSITEPLDLLKGRGFQIVAANLSDRAIDYREFDYTKPTALIMGAEVEGVSALASEACDAEVVLPMLGMVESYNVSVACALILAAAQTQRERAGMYQEVRLPKSIYDKRMFCWAHPRLAAFCDARGLPYPPLREDGEVENLVEWHRKASSASVLVSDDAGKTG